MKTFKVLAFVLLVSFSCAQDVRPDPEPEPVSEPDIAPEPPAGEGDLIWDVVVVGPDPNSGNDYGSPADGSDLFLDYPIFMDPNSTPSPLDLAPGN